MLQVLQTKVYVWYQVFQKGDYTSSWQSEGETDGETNLKTFVYWGRAWPKWFSRPLVSYDHSISSVLLSFYSFLWLSILDLNPQLHCKNFSFFPDSENKCSFFFFLLKGSSKRRWVSVWTNSTQKTKFKKGCGSKYCSGILKTLPWSPSRNWQMILTSICMLINLLSSAFFSVSPFRWVREFLNEDNKGLDVLVEYLSFAQYAVT